MSRSSVENHGSYGSWPSPISARLVAAGGNKLEGVACRGDEVWWLEVRPADKGRAVLVKDGQDQIPAPWSARSRVHEYGGGAWWLGASDAYFVEASDQRIYRLPADGGPPEALTPEPSVKSGWRYSDGHEHPDGQVMVCVREDHHRPARRPDGSDSIGLPTSSESEDVAADEPRNEIVVLATSGGVPDVLVSGSDFVSTPRISAHGRWMSWIQWDHPNMPWNETALLVAPLFGGNGGDGYRLGNPQVVAGSAAIHGAGWTSDGRLVYSSDQSGQWNLHWWTEGTGGQLTHLSKAEIGAPAWVFGTRQWAELGDGRLVAVITTEAVDSLAVLDADGVPSTIPGFARGADFKPDTPVAVGSLASTGTVGSPSVAVVVSTPTALPSIHRIDVDSGQRVDVRASDEIGVDGQWLSTAQAVRFRSDDRDAHCFFYSPALPEGSAPRPGDGAKPPLIVMGHGGPTSHTDPSLNLKVQYWTSRGFAVADVNYGGSTGFGKEYRDRLHLRWGQIDVEDCVNAARHLSGIDAVDGDRLAIRGSSAGGFTVLLALLEADCFAAGTSLYGVADLAAMVADTHKFESRYFDWLIGPYPERADLYRDRSPISHAHRLATPMLIMQGSDDKVVPPSQSEAVVGALAANGVAHAYALFEGEPHGFRQADTLVRSLELELWFYGRIFGFEPADTIEPPEHVAGLDPVG